MLTAAKAVGSLLLPPGIVIVAALAGLLLLPYRYRLGVAVLGTAVAALLVSSLAVTGQVLLRSLEASVEPLALDDPGLAARADAIVVLGGGRERSAPEPGADTVNGYTLARLRYAVRLHRATGLPLMVSGGSTFGEPVPEAELMRRTLVRDFGVSPRWIDGRSRNTYQNAAYARAWLEANNARRAFVVTHAWHMPRALWAFRRAGVEAVPAPMGYSAGNVSWLALLPTAEGLRMSSWALRERLGLLWYRLRYRRQGAAGEASGILRMPSAGA